MKRFACKTKDAPVVRLAPQEDGSVNFCLWNHELEQYDQITSLMALMVLAQEGCIVEVAINDPNDRHSHYESRAKMKRI